MSGTTPERRSLTFLILILTLQLGLLAGAAAAQPPARDPGDVDVLLIYPDQYGTNGNLVEKNLEMLGWNVTITGVSDPIEPCPWLEDWRYNPPIVPDLLVHEIDDVAAYDCVAIMSSPYWVSRPYQSLTGSAATLALIQDAADAGLVVAGFCGGPRVLAAADVLNGVTITGHNFFAAEYLAAGAIYLGPQIMPVIDGQITTNTRGLYYELENSMALSTALENLHPGTGWEANSPATAVGPAPLAGVTLRWSRALGGGFAEAARAVVPTMDGGYLLAGQTASFGAGATDIYLIKTDAEGQPQWSRTYGGTGWEYASDVVFTGDGYLVCGWTTSQGTGSKDVLVLKIDCSGDEVWTRTFGGEGVDLGWALCLVGGGDIVVAGSTESSGAGENDVYLVRLTAEGQEVWTRTYGGAAADMGCAVAATDDGGCAVAGATGSYGSGNRDAYLVKVAADGSQQWQQTYGWNNDEQELVFDWAHALVRTADGGFALAGCSNFASLHNLVLIKTDAQGRHAWHEYYGPSTFYDYGTDLAATADGGFWLGGTTCSSEDRDSDLYLVRTDAAGQVAWEGSLGGPGREYGGGLIVLPDGDLVVAGQSRSCGLGSHDVILARVADPTTTAVEPQDLPRSERPVLQQNHPNPFNPSTTVTFSLPHDAPVTLTVHDLRGRQVRSLVDRACRAGDHAVRWNGCDDGGRTVESGVYLARLMVAGRSQTRSMLLLK